jgi:hypothetical protein
MAEIKEHTGVVFGILFDQEEFFQGRTVFASPDITLGQIELNGDLLGTHPGLVHRSGIGVVRAGGEEKKDEEE